MRGVYTAGVLDYLMDQNFYPDGIVGVSAGACHATSYIAKQRGRNYRVNTAYLKGDQYLSAKQLFKTGSLFGLIMMLIIRPVLNLLWFVATWKAENRIIM